MFCFIEKNFFKPPTGKLQNNNLKKKIRRKNFHTLTLIKKYEDHITKIFYIPIWINIWKIYSIFLLMTGYWSLNGVHRVVT